MSDRLESIRKAHTIKGKTRTSRMEDYLEVIFELIEKKGYATTTDISLYLNVSAPSVTKMVKRLRDQGYLEYERYKGLRLTDKGRELANNIRERHGTLIEFLLMLGIDESLAHREAEGLEHYLEPDTLLRLEKFIKIIRSQPEVMKKLREGLPYY